MIQDISPYSYDNHYTECCPDDDSYVVFVKNNTALAKKIGNTIDFPEYSTVKTINANLSLTYLFCIRGVSGSNNSYRKFFLADNDETENALMTQGYAFESLYIFRTCEPKHLSFALITACQLATWYSEHRLCGSCGKPLEHDHKERMLACRDCKIQVYPKISPAVIIALHNGDKLLLSKYAGREYTNYALLAGFNEIGESIEDTVRREVMEEVGLKVKNIRYYKSQPWSLSSSLLLGFYCELDGSDEIHIDKNELSIAEWVDRSKLPVYQDDISLTYEMIAKFREGAF